MSRNREAWVNGMPAWANEQAEPQEQPGKVTPGKSAQTEVLLDSAEDAASLPAGGTSSAYILRILAGIDRSDGF